MNVYCIVMFEFNYSVGDIRNSDLGEEIICSGEGIGGKGGGKWGKGGRKWGKRGREVGVRGEGSGECLPPPVHPLRLRNLSILTFTTLRANSTDNNLMIFFQKTGFDI